MTNDILSDKLLSDPAKRNISYLGFNRWSAYFIETNCKIYIHIVRKSFSSTFRYFGKAAQSVLPNSNEGLIAKKCWDF